jgi:SAM-dependent methyltransferase
MTPGQSDRGPSDRGLSDRGPGDQRQLWDKRYAAEDYVFGIQPNAFLRAQTPRLRPGMTALALADGEGRNGVWLAEQGLAVTSVDLSAAGMAKASRLALERHVDLVTVCADLLEWEWPLSAFDLVAEIFLQVPEADRRLIHRWIRQALRPGGLVVIEAFHKRGVGRGGPSDPDLLYDAAGLREQFDGFEIIDLREETVRLDEGDRHQGDAEVVRLVARRPLTGPANTTG